MSEKANRTRKTIYGKGKTYGSHAAIEIIEYENGSANASAEEDLISMSEFRKAVTLEMPKYFIDDCWVEPEMGYIYAQLRLHYDSL